MSGIGHLGQEFAAITEYFSPRVVAVANGQYVKLAKFKGEFVWHSHAAEDEFFLIHRGSIVIRYRDGKNIELKAGDFHVVPRGVEHCPMAKEEAWVMFIEPASTTHSGDVESPLTKSIESQIAHLAC